MASLCARQSERLFRALTHNEKKNRVGRAFFPPPSPSPPHMAPVKRSSKPPAAKKRRAGASGAPAAAAKSSAPAPPPDARTVGQRTSHIGNKVVRAETYAKLKRERKVT